jgi:hypothetical protein
MKFSLRLILLLLAASPLIAQQKQAAPASIPVADTQIYRNPIFSFRYQIPYGWVDRTRNLQEGNDASKGEVLLAVFEHPPETTGDTVNSAVVIATEDAASYPGLKTAADYLAPLTEVTSARGFKPAADPSEITIDSHTLLRADFAKSPAPPPATPPTSNPPTTSADAKLAMAQSTLVFVAKGKIVSFTFLAGTSGEVDQLIENLDFGDGRPAPKSTPRH